MLGAVGLPLPDEAADFVSTQAAIYLDPFIDGEVPPAQYVARSVGSFAERLGDAWAARAPPGCDPPPLTLPSEAMLGAYVRHAISKMNLNCAFDAHQSGIGRLPLPPAAQRRHTLLLGATLVQAIERDFAPEDRTVRGAALTAGVLTEIAECHLGAYTCYHAQLSDALAHANAEGAGRQARERERLFGAAAADAADATGAVSCL